MDVSTHEKLVAAALDEAKRYADESTREIATQLHNLRCQVVQSDYRSHKLRFISHCLFILLGIAMTVLADKIDVTPSLASVIIPIPSLVMEAIDRIKRL